MTDNAFGVWEGEVTVELPEKFDAGLYYIGRVRTPWTRREQCPKNARESDAVCTLEVDARFAEALALVETCSHLLAGAAEPDRGERGAAGQARRGEAVGGRSRLPRRYAAPRHQAVLRLDRFGARRGRRMAQGSPGVSRCGGHVLVFFASRLTKDCESWAAVAPI
jgi:hypothetical protein